MGAEPDADARQGPFAAHEGEVPLQGTPVVAADGCGCRGGGSELGLWVQEGLEMRAGTMGNEQVGFTRTYEDRMRRQALTKVVEKSPTEQLIDANIAAYHELKREEKEREAARERDQLERERRRKEMTEHNDRVRQFQFRDQLVANVMNDHGLTEDERRECYQRLADARAIQDWCAAAVFAQEIVLSRGTK